MNFRAAFWPGFLMGALTACAVFFRKSVPASSVSFHPLLDFVSEAVVTCDASGQIAEANAAARALFGPGLAGCQRLCYPTGQPVPSGQLPLARRNFAPVPAHFLLTDAGGQARTLEAVTRLLPTGGAAVIFRDVTAHAAAEAKDVQMRADAEALHTLGLRLGQAQTRQEAADAAAEAALALGGKEAGVFAFDAERKHLTRLAASPDTRPRRPRTHQAAQAVTLPLDAADPLHWAVYVAKKTFEEADALALPLLVGGMAQGHLEVSAAPGVNREALTQAALLTGATLAARHEADRAALGAAREAALSEIAALLALPAPLDTLCDAAAAHLRRLLLAEVCTVTVDGRLRGQDYHDALLRPERHKPDDPALRHEAAETAMVSRETVQRTNLSSPDFASGVWGAFAGASGRHRVLAVPLTGKSSAGALTVWTTGDGAFTPAQVQFAETLAALLSVRPATAKVARTKPQTLPGPAGAD